MAASRFSTTAMMMAALTLAGACSAGPPQSQNASPPSTNPAGGGQVRSVSPEADQRLASEVSRFLDAWAVKRQPQAAVEGKTSAVFGDTRFVPATTLSPDEYKAQAAAAAADTSAPITQQTFQSALQTQLTAALGDEPAPQGAAPEVQRTVETLLAPFSPETVRANAPDLWELISDRNPRTLTIAGVPSLAYQVRSWDDIKWTASGTVGFRFAMESIIKQRGVNLQAVVTAVKLSTGTGEEAPLVTLWSDEGRGTEWRLVGVELPARR